MYLWVCVCTVYVCTRVSVVCVHASNTRGVHLCRPCIAALFQGRGIAGAATALSASTLKASNSHSTLTRGQSLQSSSNLFGSPSSSVKRPSLCLQVKFQLVRVSGGGGGGGGGGV